MAIDDQVRRTSGDAENKTPVTDEAALQIKQTRMKRKEEFVTFSAATVGDDIITINELEDAVRMQMVGAPDLQPGTPEFHEAMNHVAAITLQRMIEERLILQEAKWKLRDKAKLEEAFNEYIDKIWKTEELPVLLRENGVSNAYELKAKLRAKGQNYDSKKEAFRRREMARSFLNEELRHKVSHDMIELKEYYEVHKNDFIKPARITWREIEINVRRYPDRATARKKADEALARLLHNESFEAVARAISNGPTATQGGLYVDMTPGSYADPGVNQELSRLPLGQVSQVIESPTSFHIVRVDSRRDKGPLRFDEVAEQINEKIFMRNYQKAYVDYMAKLQAKTVIRTMFENSQDGLVVPDKKPAASR
jgi:peptidyl-prolyl cis-trans isomerase SurA